LPDRLRSDLPYHFLLLLPPRAQYTRRRERKQGGPRAHHHWPPRPLPSDERTGPQTRYRWTPAKQIFTTLATTERCRKYSLTPQEEAHVTVGRAVESAAVSAVTEGKSVALQPASTGSLEVHIKDSRRSPTQTFANFCGDQQSIAPLRDLVDAGTPEQHAVALIKSDEQSVKMMAALRFRLYSRFARDANISTRFVRHRRAPDPELRCRSPILLCTRCSQDLPPQAHYFGMRKIIRARNRSAAHYFKIILWHTHNVLNSPSQSTNVSRRDQKAVNSMMNYVCRPVGNIIGDGNASGIH